MVNILIVCTNQPIAETIKRLIEKVENWSADIALTLNDAIATCNKVTYDVILIGAGITDAEEQVLCLDLNKSAPKTRVVKHYGGGSGLLYAEIHQALA